MNLKDSGVDVVVGLYDGSRSAEKAKADGLEVLSVADACAKADWIMVLLPDEFQKDVYEKEIAPTSQRWQGAELCPRFQHPLRADQASPRMWTS